MLEIEKRGIIDKDFRIHRLDTSETLGEWIYGVASNMLYKYELRRGLSNAEKPWFHKVIKKVVDYAARNFNWKVR